MDVKSAEIRLFKDLERMKHLERKSLYRQPAGNCCGMFKEDMPICCGAGKKSDIDIKAVEKITHSTKIENIK